MQKIKSNMTLQIMIAVVLGIVVGLVVGPPVTKIKVVGDIFLRLIQMSVVPLIMGAVIEAVGSLDPKELGKLGGKILFWFSIGTIIAAAFGIAAGYIVMPGKGLEIISSTAIEAPDQGFLDILVDFFPTNVVRAMADANMIQVIVFSILFGFSLSVLTKNNQEMKILDGIKQFNVVILSVVKTIMFIAPIGIFALLADVTGRIGIKVIMPLIKFLLALGVMSFIYLFLFILFVGFYAKISPVKLAKKMSKMTLVALTTTSSAITLPTKMEDSENKLGVSKRISRLVNPLGMALNSNGLSMFLTLACITIAQMYNVELSIPTLFRIVMLSALACLGTVVVPGGGIVALTIVVPGVGLPIEGIAMLAGIDWFSGMFRTMLNVDIDALVAVLIAKDEDELSYEIFNSEVYED